MYSLRSACLQGYIFSEGRQGHVYRHRGNMCMVLVLCRHSVIHERAELIKMSRTSWLGYYQYRDCHAIYYSSDTRDKAQHMFIATWYVLLQLLYELYFQKIDGAGTVEVTVRVRSKYTEVQVFSRNVYMLSFSLFASHSEWWGAI